MWSGTRHRYPSACFPISIVDYAKPPIIFLLPSASLCHDIACIGVSAKGSRFLRHPGPFTAFYAILESLGFEHRLRAQVMARGESVSELAIQTAMTVDVSMDGHYELTGLESVCNAFLEE